MENSGSSLWFFLAIAASIVWGLSYALSEKLMKGGLPPTFVMACTGALYLLICVVIATGTGHFKQGLGTLQESKNLLPLLLLVGSLHAIGALLIYYSISMKNATLTSLVEITYPLFTAIFAYVLYREVQVNLWTAFGGLMIFSGITLIYLKA